MERGRCTFRACGSWLPRKFGDCLIACSVTLAFPLASYLLTPACVGTPAGSAGSGNPIRKRDSGSNTCSVRDQGTCIDGSNDTVRLQ